MPTDNSPPGNPPPDSNPDNPNAGLNGRTGLMARIGDLIRAGTGVIGALPVLMVLRSGVLRSVGQADKPEPTQTPSTLVETLQALIKAVLVTSEGHRMPELLRLLLSALLLRLRISESIGQDLDAVGNAHQLEPAALAIVQAYVEEPRARALLPDTTPDILKDLAELQFRSELLEELRGPTALLEGGVYEVQHRVNQFIRQHVVSLAPLAAQIPRLRGVLAPAQGFVSGPAFKGQETQKVKAKAREEGRAEGRAEAEAEARRQPPAAGGAAAVVNLQTAPAVTPPADPPATPAPPRTTSRRTGR